ncbi:hypothetical protein D915_006157 [Fasciola hepatica]|uniref:Uncharacterized protein n=1 Tax=Fasciola hepatica TaxID=6192 RepID=A0A4E0RXL3_FASHE|nr:hypothetical protein D915_006157 [Fasciola hepatica]
MATKEAESVESGYYVNVSSVRPSFLARQRILTEEELRNMEASDETLDSSLEEAYQYRIKSVKERIHGNLDQLDYLQGISNLERNFSSLMDQVLHTALTLSREDSIPNSKYVYDEQMEDKVERCWKYITQLTDATQWHVMQASRYHKFHHEVRTAQTQLTKLVSSHKELVGSLIKTPIQLNCKSLGHAHRNIQMQLTRFMELAGTARQLSTQSRVVAPLHYRKHLPAGRHSANLLASIRVAPDAWLHRGDAVRVWANSQVAADLLREWTTETTDGRHTTTIPAGCLWLTSPEASPASSPQQEHSSRISVYAGQGVEQEQSKDGGSIGAEVDSGSSCSDITRSKRKKKCRVNFFSNNKALASKFQATLFGSWTDIIGDWAVLLLPTYRQYMENMVNKEGDIKSNQEDQLNEMKSGLQSLTDYGDNQMRKLFASFSSKQIQPMTGEDEARPEELNQLLQTLNAWNNLRSQLLETKKTASVRSMSQEAFVQSSETTQDRRLRSFDARPVLDLRDDFRLKSTEASYIRATEYGTDPIDELVTSFAEPAPRTYRILTDGKAQFVEREYSSSPKQTPTAVVPDKHARSHSSPRLKAATKDLMTQISTPYIPTLVHCPKCAMEYEIDVYRSPSELTTPIGPEMEGFCYQDGRKSLLQFSPRPRHSKGRQNDLMVLASPPISTGKVQSADSMPALSTAREPRYMTGDSSLSSRSRPMESVSKMHKRLGRWNKHRPHSFSSATGGILTPGMTDTTASSGIGSLAETPTLDDSEMRTLREPVTKQAEKSRQKTGRISIFKWGKKRKGTPESISPGTDSMGTEPEPMEVHSPLVVERHSALHVQTALPHSDSNATLTDQDTPKPVLATPIIRSRSWVQQGTPWGYGPPLHEHWHPSVEYVITQERPRIQHTPGHSERLRSRASRQRVSSDKVFSSVDSDRSMWFDYSSIDQAIDSGIQTDTDLIAGRMDWIPKQVKQTQTLGGRKTEGLCPECRKNKMLPAQVHEAVQCGACFQHIGVGGDLSKVQTISVSCQVGKDSENKRGPNQVWDVSCQVGVITRNRETAVDGQELEPKYDSAEKHPKTQEIAVQTIPDTKPCLVEDANFRKHRQMMYSVSCQVGQIVRTIASGPEHLEAVQLLDESIEKFSRPSPNELTKSTIKPFTVPVGKKFQVGKPWLEDIQPVTSELAAVSHQKPPSRDVMFALNIPASGSKLESPMENYSREVQTHITGQVIPYTRPACERCIQADFDGDQRLAGDSKLGNIISLEEKLLCSRSTWHIIRGPAMMSASTMIGYQTEESAQQTDLKSSDTEMTVLQAEQDSSAFESQAVLLPLDHEEQLSDANIPIVTEPPREQTTDLKLPMKEESAEARSAVSTRAKRIQKGSPHLLPRGTDRYRQTPGSEVNKEPTEDYHIQPDETFHTRRSPSLQRPCFQRVVVNVGLYDEKTPSGRRHRSLLECGHSPHDRTELTSGSTESSTTDTEETIEMTTRRSHLHHSTHTRCISVPSSSVNMCFHLEPSAKTYEPHQWTTNRHQKRKCGGQNACDRTERSWSSDDVRTHNQSSERTTVAQSDAHNYGTENSERTGIQVGNCPGIDRGSGGARRRIDQWKHRHDYYRYY